MILSKKSGTKEDSSIKLEVASSQDLPMAFATSCSITLTTPPVSQKLPRDILSSCDRETDIISDDVDVDLIQDGEKDPMDCDDIEREIMSLDETSSRRSFLLSPLDDPLLCDDILSCISALDDVIAEFDDPSLPYINEDEDSLNNEQVNPSGQSLSSTGTTASSQFTNFPLDGKNELVSNSERVKSHKEHSGLKQQESNYNKFPSHHQNQIPVKSTDSSFSFEAIFPQKYISSPTSSSSSSSFSGKLPKSKESQSQQSFSEKAHHSSSSSSSSSKPRSIDNKSVSSSGSGSGTGHINANKLSSDSGTYSKATNYEIRLPRIPSDVFPEEEPIYSSSKTRPQLSRGIFTSTEVVVGKSEPYPNEPEVDYNHIEDNNNASAEALISSLGKMSKPSSGLGGKEEWNFPSEKNLPRSLRKTRKTCLLDEEEGGKSEGKMSNESDVNGSLSIASGQTSCSSSCSSKCCEEMNQDNGKRDDNHKIYEDIVVHNAKSHRHKNEEETSQKSYSSSSSLSFHSDQLCGVGPKPRNRQQIPVQEILTKYPPGKVPKPNPKPGINANRTELSSPLSLSEEISRDEDDDGGGCVRTEKIGLLSSPVDNQNSKTSGPMGGEEEIKNLNNGQGNIMRMMMMMKPSAKNNSTGSASSISISRSSSSSSGGDPNYYNSRKDTLSSSSGVVLTTNSSTTSSASATNTNTNNNSNHNNNKNNSVTIINTPTSEKEVKPSKGNGMGGGEIKSQNKRITCLQQQNKAVGVKPSGGGGGNGTPGGTNTGGVLDVDDGYLSMINRNEAPLLWPEEFIENETFSPDELKRLSVHLPSDSDDSCSEEGKDAEIELEIVDYEREPSRRHPHHNHSNNHRAKSSSAPVNRTHSRDTNTTNSSGGNDKTDYFSDDSLEGESEESFHEGQLNLRGSSASPYHGESHGAKRSHSSRLTPHNQYQQYHHQNIIVVNHGAIVQQQNTPNKSQISRIPKMVQGNHQAKGNSSSSRSSPSKESTQPMRKPCSFFISLNDGQSSSEVNDVSRKTTSLPKGSKVAISPVKKVEARFATNKDLTHPQIDIDHDKNDTRKTNVTLSSNPTFNVSPSTKSKHLISHLPQLRHTKSINTGGPRLRNNNNPSSAVANANKRKSTSDLVTVVIPETISGESHQKAGVNVSSFNRTATFLIPYSRSTGEVKNREQKQSEQQKDDETDNDEDDLSSDFDLISSTEPDSIQPLSIHDVHDFVSEIMDTAMRHGLTKQIYKNNSNPLVLTQEDLDSQVQDTTVEPSLSFEQPTETSIRKETQKDDQSIEIINRIEEEETQELSSGDNYKTTLEVASMMVRDDYCGESLKTCQYQQQPTVAEQLEAVVTTFLSDNESFLKKGEESEEEKEGGDNECDLFVKESCKDEEKRESKVESQKVQVEEEMAQEVMNFATSINTTDVDNEPVKTREEPSMIHSNVTTTVLRDSSLLGEEKILDEFDDEEEEIDEELPPAFIPTPPPKIISNEVLEKPISQICNTNGILLTRKHYKSETRFGKMNHHNINNHHHLHNSNVREGKAALDLLAERISNSKKFSVPDDQLAVSQFIHDKRNIWALYDRPFDEDLLPVNSGVRGYASRSQENLMDAMTKERFQKSFSARGQSSTLPLNCRPPTSQRRSSTFRNMFNKFRRTKQSETCMKEIPEYHPDDEIQSITSRETGPSEAGKKRGFFSRLFRRSKKH